MANSDDRRERKASNGDKVSGADDDDISASDFPILARTDFSDVTFLLEIHHPAMARAARPGQFVIFITHDHGERIPLTIADFDRRAGTVTLVVQAVGKSTRQMQRDLSGGDGAPRHGRPHGGAEPGRRGPKVVCVGGGLGRGAGLPQARAFKEAGAYVIGVVGFRNQGLIFWEDKFRHCLRRVRSSAPTTARPGIKGLVTGGIEAGHRRTRTSTRSSPSARPS